MVKRVRSSTEHQEQDLKKSRKQNLVVNTEISAIIEKTFNEGCYISAVINDTKFQGVLIAENNLTQNEYLKNAINRINFEDWIPLKAPPKLPKTKPPSPLQSVEMAPKEIRKIRVVVIGAGIAGLSATIQLQKLGYEVILVEAMKHVGGRCFSKNEIDLGANWIHGTDENPITNLCRKYNIELVKSRDNITIFDSDGSVIPSGLETKIGQIYSKILDKVQIRVNQKIDSFSNNKDSKKSESKKNEQKKIETCTLKTPEKGKKSDLSFEQREDLVKSQTPVESTPEIIRLLTSKQKKTLCRQNSDIYLCPFCDRPMLSFSGLRAHVSRYCPEISFPEKSPPISGDAQKKSIIDIQDSQPSNENTNEMNDNNEKKVDPSEIFNSFSSNSFAKDFSLQEIIDELIQEEEEENNGFTDQEKRLFAWHNAYLECSFNSNLNQVSAKYWDYDDPFQFPGPDSMIKGGFQVLAEKLAEEVSDLELQFQVTKIVYPNSNEKISRNDPPDDYYCRIYGVDTTGKKVFVRSDMVLVTVSLGVLKSKIIEFLPPLPPNKLEAIEKVGYGILNKIAIEFPVTFWREHLSEGVTNFGRNFEHKSGFFWFTDISEAVKRPVLIGILAGSVARESEDWSDTKLNENLFSILNDIFPGKIPNPIRIIRSKWLKNRWMQGSYSFLPVNCSPETIDILASPVCNRIFFAGEATHVKNQSTVHGAWLSGIREANLIDITVQPESEEFDQLINIEPSSTDECSLCHEKRGSTFERICGNLICFSQGKQNFLVHQFCASYSPEVQESLNCWSNVIVCIRRGKRLRCSFCKKHGATIGCFKSVCRKVYHLVCAEETDWDFTKKGKEYYCRDHRESDNESIKSEC